MHSRAWSFLVALVLLATLGGAAASSAGAVSKVWIPSRYYGPILLQRPTTLEVDFRSAHSGLAFLHWTSWGGKTAVAYGEYGEFCNPYSVIGGRTSCVSGDYTNRFAKLVLSRLRSCKVDGGAVDAHREIEWPSRIGLGDEVIRNVLVGDAAVLNLFDDCVERRFSCGGLGLLGHGVFP